MAEQIKTFASSDPFAPRNSRAFEYTIGLEGVEGVQATGTTASDKAQADDDAFWAAVDRSITPIKVLCTTPSAVHCVTMFNAEPLTGSRFGAPNVLPENFLLATEVV